MAGYYLSGLDPMTALASPRFADLRGLAPMLIHVGGAEALLDDGRNFAAATQAGNDVTLECWEHMIHVWHTSPILPESNAAIGHVGEWLRPDGPWRTWRCSHETGTDHMATMTRPAKGPRCAAAPRSAHDRHTPHPRRL